MSALARYWSMPAAELSAHLAKRRQEGATAVVPFVRSTPPEKPLVPASARRRLTFKGFDDFMPAFRAAREAAIAKHGPKWWMDPSVCIGARVPLAWVSWKGRSISGKSSRDLHFPLAEYWTNGQLPIGPEYAAPISVAQFVNPAPRRRATIDAPAWEWLADAAD